MKNKDTAKGKTKQDRIKEKASEEQVSKAATDKADLAIAKISAESRNPRRDKTARNS